LLAQNQGNFILARIYRLKSFFISRINQVLAEPQASFLGGLLIGAKKAIPADLQSYFNKTGTTHIVAVSGYNITIIAAFLMLLANNLGLGRKKSFWLICGFLVIFLIITGLQASILRAAIGRRSQVANALVLAAVIMLLFNPKILVYDLGFQLSFLATLGLVYLNPVLNQILTQTLKILNLKFKIVQVIIGDYLLTTLSAIIMTQPLILYQFGKIALIAPVANILVLPVIPLAMLLGFITGLGAMIWPSLGWVLGWPVWLVLSYIIFVLENLANLPWSYWEIPKIGVGWLVLLYLLISGFIYKIKAKAKVKIDRSSVL
jgi:competence protein ComEC